MTFTIRICMTKGSQPTRIKQDGTISVSKTSTRLGKAGWRSVLAVDGSKQRLFGCTKDTVAESVHLLLQRVSDQLSSDEEARVRQVALGFQAPGLSANTLDCCPQSDPLSQDVQRNVAFVHQIYGVFRDGKPMSTLFAKSHYRWQTLAGVMGATYILWSADQVDTLIKDHYPDCWGMYTEARYPVMRVDIGRVAILHRYGGLYADLDVLPNSSAYRQVPLAVGMVPDRQTRKTYYLDMELLVATQGNGALLGWLNHMKQEIGSKSYSEPKSFWYGAKMRYIYNTTGPYSMQRFLRLPANKALYASVTFLHLNRPDQAQSLNATQSRQYDAISYHSVSYLTKAHSQSVRVVKQSVPLPDTPALLARKRLRQKTPGRSTDENEAASSATKQARRLGSASQCIVGDNILQAHSQQPKDNILHDELDRERAESMRKRTLLHDQVGISEQLAKHIWDRRREARGSEMWDSLPKHLAQWVRQRWE